jgi:ketosteroid isomerase-like protein
MEQTLSDANNDFYEALASLLAGDVSPMEAIWSDAGDVSNLGPFVERTIGAKAVREQFRGEAGLALGGQVVVTDLHIVDLGDVGYTSGVENGTGHTGPDGQPMELRHRFTNIFRRESGSWRIIHHHTDRAK